MILIVLPNSRKIDKYLDAKILQDLLRTDAGTFQDSRRSEGTSGDTNKFGSFGSDESLICIRFGDDIVCVFNTDGFVAPEKYSR